MSKYDFEVDLDTHSSTGKILSKITPGSIVLEFGCAAGRMTKYMKNALYCQVYIVEYDKEAFDVAIQYAVGGVCDDILSLSWLEEFQNIRFDTILFVDVLEHLSRPNVVLSRVAEVLKDNGHIYISIPNITHNDIILKELDNHFDYMNLGILDDTHVHFWGYENIVPLAKDNGLVVESVEATYRPTGSTEQYENEILKCSPILLNYLNERKYAEAYQFIVVMKKQLAEKEDNNDIDNDCLSSFITSHLYIDNGNDFDEKDIKVIQSENIAPGRYITHYVLNDTNAIKRLRFDPIESQGCILQNFSARQAGKQLEYTYSEHLTLTDGILMLGTDPMVLIDVPSDERSDAITIDADIVILGDEYFDILQKNCIGFQAENKDLHGKINSLNEQVGNLIEQNERLDEAVNSLNSKNEELSEEINNLNVQNERLNGAVNNLNVQNEKLIGEVGSSNAQSEKLNREVSSLNAQNEKLSGEVSSLNEQNEKLSGEVSSLNEQNEKLSGEVSSLNAQNEKLNEEVSSLNAQNEKLNEEVSSLNAQNEKLNGEVSSLNAQNISIKSDIGAYILLANKKDELLIVKEKLLGEKDAIIKEKDILANEKEEYIRKLEERVDYFENRKCIKICNKFWKIYWKIRLGLRRIVGKKGKDE